MSATTRTRRRVAFPASELPAGSRKVLLAGRREIAVLNTGDRLFAVFNRCPHQQAPLDAGPLGGTQLPSPVGEYRFGMRDQVLRCPWHHYEFDLETGRCLADPQRLRVATYEVRHEGDEIAVYVCEERAVIEPREPKIDWDLRCRPTLAAIASRLAPEWRGYFRIADDGARSVSTNATTSTEWGGVLPGTLYDRPQDDPAAAASRTPAEAVALLDRFGLERAVLDPGIAGRLSGLASTRWAAALARAVNDWVLEEWLPADERLHASILVGPRSAAMAADEVRRIGGRQRVARVVLAYPPLLLGDRSFHPLLAAASELGLPIHVQAGGAWTGANAGLAGAGDPASAFEASAGWTAAAQPHLASLIGQGTFERFPDLRIVFGGFGVAWLPSLLWQLDAAYREGLALPPAQVSSLPSDLVRRHVRFCTAGLASPADASDLFGLLDLVDARELLLFGSGAAGLDGAATAALVDGLPDAWRGPVLRENVLALALAFAA